VTFHTAASSDQSEWQKTMADASLAVTAVCGFPPDTKSWTTAGTLSSVSYPLLKDLGYYLTPKVGYTIPSTEWGRTHHLLPDASRTLPIFSTDTGLVFERDDSFLGNGYIQTMEPRLYYVYVPYRTRTVAQLRSAQAPSISADIH